APPASPSASVRPQHPQPPVRDPVRAATSERATPCSDNSLRFLPPIRSAHEPSTVGGGVAGKRGRRDTKRSHRNANRDRRTTRVTDDQRAEIGVIGGSGLYQLLDNAAEVAVSTPYG